MKHAIFFAMMSVIGACAASAHGIISEDVSVDNTSASVSLAGTLTIPADNSAKAAVILASGSGAQNRDEEIAGHRPFKTIAETLSERGFAVLRLDDRGTGLSGGDFSSASSVDLTEDVKCGLRWLRMRFSDIPSGIIGHSEGGIHAVRSAADGETDFIVTMGAPAWKGDSVIISQSRALALSHSGKWDGEKTQRELLEIAGSHLPDVAVRGALQLCLKNAYGELADLPKIKDLISKQLSVLCSKWYREMLRYDPANDIRAVKCAWLAINGDHDMQVLPDNLKTIKDLHPSVETVLLEKHNHLLQHCVTGSPDEYAVIAEDISPEVLDLIGTWLDTVAESHNNIYSACE